MRDSLDSGNITAIGNESDSMRIDGSAYARAAEKAGLKRCGRRAATDALADEIDTPLFAATDVRYIGEPVAAVAADTPSRFAMRGIGQPNS